MYSTGGADETRKRFRRLRPQEIEALNTIETQLEAARQVVQTIHRKRQQFLRAAFQKGHVVTYKELQKMARCPR